MTMMTQIITDTETAAATKSQTNTRHTDRLD